MGLKQIPTDHFLAYLKYLGLVFVRRKRHYVFDYPDGHPKGKLLRPITLREQKKDIPLMHIHSNLRTIDPVNGKADFEKWYSDYTGSGKKKK